LVFEKPVLTPSLPSFSETETAVTIEFHLINMEKMMANVKLRLGHEVELGKVDSTLVVMNTSDERIGELHFSKGSVEWWPKGNSVNCKTYSWPQLAKVLSDNGTPKKVAKIKAPKVIATKAAAVHPNPIGKRTPRPAQTV
jgi:hypothetical protein